MKKLFVIITVLVFMSPVLTHAFVVRCDQMEYAEIKDMDRDQMKSAFCKQQNTGRLLMQMRRPNREIDECSNILEKIINAYKSKFGEDINPRTFCGQ